jgi:hypothetical protein
MPNIFDKMQSNLHDTINKTFGYVVSWTSSVSSEEQIALCLFNEPTKEYKIGDFEYSPNLYSIAYKVSDLIGLYEAIRANESETIFIYEIGSSIETAKQYACMKAGATNDGKTIEIVIELL